ncbi:MAG: glycosyltransferase [Ilumatobacteraceae bacterium]
MIGFYVHHHGAGHLARSQAIIHELVAPTAVFTSLPTCRAMFPLGTHLVELPDDRVVGSTVEPTAGGGLHWAPTGLAPIKVRSRLLGTWLTGPDAQLLVCDVSVEMAVLGRLCGVPTVVVRSHGDRSDRPHRLALDTAAGLLAPFPAELEDARTPAHIRDRTFYAGLFSRPWPSPISQADARCELGLDRDAPVLTIVVGAGGSSLEASAVGEIASRLRGWQVVLVGTSARPGAGGGVHTVGWVADVRPWLRAATVVAGHAGANLVAEIALADRPFICVPEERPHDEQYGRARRLEATGAAVVANGWPSAPAWPALVDAAQILGSSRLHGWAVAASPRDAAQWLESVHRRHASGEVA